MPTDNRDRILITGGSGFIGTNAVEWFLRKGLSVLNLDSKTPPNPAHANIWKRCDVLDAREIKEAVVEFQPRYVLHLAARTDLDGGKLGDYECNFTGVTNIIDALNAVGGVARTIFVSSRMVCRIDYQPNGETDYCPPNLYGESKVLSEQIVRESSIASEWTIVRPTSIWGPWFEVPYRIFFDSIARGVYFSPGSHDPKKSFGFVGNTLYQLDKLISAPAPLVQGRTFYLCDYPPLRLNNWSELIRKELGRGPIRSVPYGVLKLGALTGDLAKALGWTQPPLTSFRLRNLVTEMVYDTRQLEEICGELPFSLEDGVRKTVAWMREPAPRAGLMPLPSGADARES